MNDEPGAIATHLEATKHLIAACLERLKSEDPQACAGAMAAMKGGASVKVTTALSVAGLREVAVELVDMHGSAVTLAHVAFEQTTWN